MGTSSLARGLAERIVGFRRLDIPGHVSITSRKSVLDTIGVTVAGCYSPEAEIVTAVHGGGAGSGSAVLIGRGGFASPLDAALINGTASHALDFDDFSGSLGGHHSAPVVSALLALLGERTVSGSELLTAYVVGCEVTILLASAVHPHHYDRGWHPTATLGVFGTAAACAHLLGLDVERTTTALAIAASLAAGLKANFGTMTKPLHVGLTARSGLMAALLAAEGFTGNADVFEHHQGFLEVFNGAGNYNTTGLLERFARPLSLSEPSIAIKQYPCCGSTHTAIEAAMRIAARSEHDPARMDAVVIEIPRQRLRHTNRAHPGTPLEAKFSVQYATARALLDREVRLADFTPERVREERVVNLLDRIEVQPVDPHPGGLGSWGAAIVVRYRGGRIVTERIHDMPGRSGKHAMSWEEVARKFSDCTAEFLPMERTQRLCKAVHDLEQLTDASVLAVLAAPEASPSADPSGMRPKRSK